MSCLYPIQWSIGKQILSPYVFCVCVGGNLLAILKGNGNNANEYSISQNMIKCSDLSAAQTQNQMKWLSFQIFPF